MQSQTWRQWAIQQMTTRGMFEGDAEEVLVMLETDWPEMAGRWNDAISGYSVGLQQTALLTLLKVALDYIDDVMPQAGFRSNFVA